MKIINKNLIALLLVMLIAFTSLYMFGCDREDVIATPDSVPTSIATIDETANGAEVTTEAVTQNTTASESTTSAAATETTVGATINDNTSTGNGSNNKPADKVILTEGNTSSQHIHSYGWVTKKATCTRDGYTEYSCACGAVYTDDYVEAYGHDWSAWETVKEATTESEGKRQKVCSTCGKVKSENIDKVASPYDASCRSDEDLLCERILYYINAYRDSDAYFNYDMKQFADMRAVQLADNFAHDIDDIREVATKLKYGNYIKEEETIYNWETDSIEKTGKIIEYYDGNPCEAIGKSTNAGGSIDEMASRVADMFYYSDAHWRYVGSAENSYVAIGVYFDGPTMYTCVIVG